MAELFAADGRQGWGPAGRKPWEGSHPGHCRCGPQPEPDGHGRHAREDVFGVDEGGEAFAVPVAVPAPAPGPATAVVTGTAPSGRLGGQQSGQQDAYREFARRMLTLHQVLPHTTGQMPMCSCGSVARICPVVNSAHELLGHPVPWDRRPGPQRVPGHDR